jgi:hypothetical protein
MKYPTTYWVITSLAIIILFIGFFDTKALAFLEHVSTTNVDFLAVVASFKLIMGSLSHMELPFISGTSAQITTSLNKAETYLLFVNAITFIQLLFITISKSLLFKITVVALFVLSIFQRQGQLSAKIVVLLLAINPGISIYTAAIDQLTQATHLSFGKSYLTELRNSEAALRLEKSQLMAEHNKEITQINNGNKGVRVLQRFQTDVGYDIKKIKADIHGDFAHTRLLLKTGGHQMIARIFNFCTMVLFCMLVLPLGYSVLLYVLFNALFKSAAVQHVEANLTHNLENDLGIWPSRVLQRIGWNKTSTPNHSTKAKETAPSKS